MADRGSVARGHDVRTGLEDIAVLPDGRETSCNGELVAPLLLARGA
ncbi:MAG TPA: hypothetical protein VIZ60_15475 [Rubrobacter sp.]